MTPLAGEEQKIFMAAIPAPQPGNALVEVATFQVAVNDLFKVGTPEPIKSEFDLTSTVWQNRAFF